MSQAFFAPNKSLTGGAVIVSFNSKEAEVWLKLAKQVNNNPDKKNFDFTKAVNVKLSADEAAGIVRAIRTGGEFKLYHNFQGNVTSGNYSFYSIDQEGKAPRTGFGLKISKDGVEYKVGFTEDSAERLKMYLEFALDHIFTADYAEDKAKAAEYLAKKGGGQPTAAKPAQKPVAKKKVTPEPEPEPEQEAETADDEQNDTVAEDDIF